MPRKPMADPIKHCERCGKLLRRKRYGDVLEDMTRFKARRFCSLRCANSRGIWGQSSSTQHRISAKLRKKRCESCGKVPPRGQLHVHHINGDWRDHRAENLQTLCIGCHLGKGHNKKEPKLCKVCEQPSRRLGMCQKHYQRWKKYGDPFLTKIRKKGVANAYSLERES